MITYLYCLYSTVSVSKLTEYKLQKVVDRQQVCGFGP